MGCVMPCAGAEGRNCEKKWVGVCTNFPTGFLGGRPKFEVWPLGASRLTLNA